MRVRRLLAGLVSVLLVSGVGLMDTPSAAAAPPEGIPAVAPGSTPAGYLPLDQFGIVPTPISDEEFIDKTVPEFEFANRKYTKLSISSNGYVIAGGAAADGSDQNCCNLPTGPSPARPNAIIAPFWTDLDGTGSPGIFAGTFTDQQKSWYVIEWRVHTFGTTSSRVFELWLGLNGVEDISMVYDPGALPQRPPGQDLLVGAENSAGAGDMRSFAPTQDLRVTSTVANYAATLAVVSGSGQTAESGQPYAQPLVAKVTGKDGQPFAGEPVTFTVTSGTASFASGSSATVTSGADGRVTAPTLTAGSTAGPVTITASAQYADPVTYSATVTRTANAIEATSGGGQKAAANSTFAQPLVATVTARDGGPLAGAPVTFTVTSGSASFGGASSATRTTDSAGHATSPALSAGSATGPVTVTAATPGVTPNASYSLTVTAASADLSAALTVPAGARKNQAFTVKLTVANAGPSPATNVGSGIALPAGMKVTNAGGGAVTDNGRAVGFVRSSLAAGSSVDYTVTVVASNTGEQTITGATASGQVRDPAAANNGAQKKITITR